MRNNPGITIPTGKRWDIVAGLIQQLNTECGEVTIAEVGVCKGATSRFVLEAGLNIRRYLLVDNKKNDEFSIWLHERVFGNVTYLLMESESAASITPDDSLDLVFIDATHTYERVKTDIELWEPKVRSGGILCGHDYDNKRFAGVAEAVDEAFGDRVILAPTRACSIWIVRKE